MQSSRSVDSHDDNSSLERLPFNLPTVPPILYAVQRNGLHNVDAYYLDLAIRPASEPENNTTMHREIYGLSILVHSRFVQRETVDNQSSIPSFGLSSRARDINQSHAEPEAYYVDSRTIAPTVANPNVLILTSSSEDDYETYFTPELSIDLESVQSQEAARVSKCKSDPIVQINDLLNQQITEHFQCLH